jgi:hypothetical protein
MEPGKTTFRRPDGLVPKYLGGDAAPPYQKNFQD